MGRVHRDRGQKRGHTLRGNQTLQGEVADKLMRRRQVHVNFARLIEQEHRIVKHGIGCRGRANGVSLLWGQA
jgi:hypothetical protein